MRKQSWMAEKITEKFSHHSYQMLQLPSNPHLSSMNAKGFSGFLLIFTTGSMPGTLEPGKAAISALLKMAFSCSSVT